MVSPTPLPRDLADDRPVAVIGAGPAGLIAAERLATAGLAVTVFDRMGAPGRKLLLAGRGGLNLTHSEPMDRLVTRYGDASARLGPYLDAFDAAALVEWCEGLGQPTFVGSSGRIFPESLRANELLAEWLRRLDGLGVEVRTRYRWTGWGSDGSLGFDREGPDGASESISVDAAATILALGGASWPSSGSDGSWSTVLDEEGVARVPFRPANSGFAVDWSEPMIRDFAGTPIKNVAVRHGDDRARGELMVTDVGLEGGALYAVSRSLTATCDRDGSATLGIDLLPDLDVAAIERRLQSARPKDSVTTLLRRRLGLDAVKVALLREATRNTVPTDASLARLVKAVPLTVLGPVGIERAISSSGGVRLDQVDDSLMLIDRPGTFLAGEMLDWDAPTGGYLLQACFSTGVAAADGALRWLSDR